MADTSKNEASTSSPDRDRAPEREEEEYDGQGNRDNGEEAFAVPQPRKKPGLLSRYFPKLELDAPTVIMMFKGSLPPIIALAIYQSTDVASYFGLFGYIIPIISILIPVVLPRGKFLMIMLLALFFTCFAAAISLLALWSAIQARLHTSTEEIRQSPLPTYNSSQAAVCGIWLFFNTWLGNILRAKYASFNLPVITFCIFVNICATYGVTLTSTAAAEAFVRRLFVEFLVAIALSTAVSLLVFPVSSRLVVFKEFSGSIGLLGKTVALQQAYLIRLESDDMFATATRTRTSPGPEGVNKDPKKQSLTKEEKAAKALEQTAEKMTELAGKLHADLVFAKRDVAWGKLDANDLGEMLTLFRNLYIPIMGMTTIIDIFKRVSEHRGWDVDENTPVEVVAEKEGEKRVWNEVMKQLHEPFGILSKAIDQGLIHAGICLELLPRPKGSGKAKDVEARGQNVKPGEVGFSQTICQHLQEFRSKRSEVLSTWGKERAIIDEDRLNGPGGHLPEEWWERERSQLYVVLYMETLMLSSGQAVQELVAYAEKKVTDGTMTKKRLILPGYRRMRKWLRAIFNNEDSSAEQSPDIMDGGANIVYFGHGYNKKRDPEHLPPVTAWQHFGNGLRKVSGFFASEESSFAFRVACATMTVGIVAYLEDSHHFFIEQRLVWAMIIITIGMSMTSGQSLFGFFCRITGTVLAMCGSLIAWYIVDGRKAGVFVILWLFTFIDYYVLIKFPQLTIAVIITVVTQILIIGYELQVDKIGKEASERTGLPYYPTSTLAPYRLACVAGGSLVAFIWTIFPKPVSDRTWLRRDLSATLYLTANYFGVINSILKASLDDTAGDFNRPGTPANQLYKAGRKIFGKVMMVIPSMILHSAWQKWEPTIGGRFPREAYDDIILRSTRIMNYLTLISYTLTHPNRKRCSDNDKHEETDIDGHGAPGRQSDATALNEENATAWRDALTKVFEALNPTHHAILSSLTLLSNSLLSGQSLPPFVPLPRPYEMTRRLMWLERYGSAGSAYEDFVSRSIDLRTTAKEERPTTSQSRPLSQAGRPLNILDPRNMDQPGYAEFAVLQVCTTLVCDDLEGLMRDVSGLVGVVDFSFRVGGSDSTLGSGAAGPGVNNNTKGKTA
ncbi:hypothetical protein OQA88_5264 [Cercophora sp. LCS_1]